MTGIDARFKTRLGGFDLDATFTAPASGVTGIFGPSGGGKTTILRCIAGLTRATSGRFALDDDIWQDDTHFLKPHERPVGYVFQDARLFSHLNVAGNLDFAETRAGSGARDIRRDEIVELLGLGRLLDQSTLTLSGGERQRAAIARALLTQPRILLMDEPLSALDQNAKREILPYLENLIHAVRLPVLYVSHDIAEIERLASHLILLSDDGKVRAAGPIAQLLSDTSLPLARAPEAAVVWDVVVEGREADYDLTTCGIGGEHLFIPGDVGDAGRVRRVRIKASDVSLTRERATRTSILNIFSMRVVSAEPIGTAQMTALLALESDPAVRLLSVLTRKSWDQLDLKPGDAVFAQVKGMALADNG